MLVRDDGGGYTTPSMALQVAPEDLLAAAASFETAANKANTWLVQNQHNLIVDAPGADQVSTDVAGWLTDNATGAMGAVPAVRKAVLQLLQTAEQMRAAAASYGLTDADLTGDVTAAGQA